MAINEPTRAAPFDPRLGGSVTTQVVNVYVNAYAGPTGTAQGGHTTESFDAAVERAVRRVLANHSGG